MTCKKLEINETQSTFDVNCTTITISNDGTAGVLIDFDTGINADSYCLCEGQVLQLSGSITTLYAKSEHGSNHLHLIYS